MNCQSYLRRHQDARQLRRRWFLGECGVGLGAMALSQLLGRPTQAVESSGNPLAARLPHFAPKAKRVIYLFMAGGPSHLEMFDNKPALTEFDGKLPPAELMEGYRSAFIMPGAKLLGPKFKFSKHGECGAELSEVLPNMAKVVDDITIIKSMKTTAFNHAPAQIEMNTGRPQFGRPSMGAWTLYGLGSESENLPGYVVFSTGSKGPSGGSSNWGSGFLPTTFQGVQFRGSGDPVMYLSSPQGVDRKLQRDSLDAINDLNQMRLQEVRDPEIATRISSFEMAFRMQAEAPDVVDLTQESQQTLDMYGAEPGTPSFANSCLLGRRLLEKGTRFVQIFHEAWDQHGGLTSGIKKNCKDTEQACAALVMDLKQRGLLKDTLVIWGGEFGRTPMVQGGNDGRDHHPNAFTMWLAGGGIKGGITYGQTDELGFNATEDVVPTYDLHATILHLLGLDCNRLSFKFQGLDQKLIGVAPAKPVAGIMA
jgi:hypothetical protein